jgi:hypothetical protein
VRKRAAIVLRVLIGLVLLATAAGKLLDVGGFARVLETYRLVSPSLLLALALAIPLAELALAIWLLSGARPAIAAAAAGLLHAGYGSVAAATLLRGIPVENCGCFGVFFPRPLGWNTVVEDVVMVALSAGLLAASLPRS